MTFDHRWEAEHAHREWGREPHFELVNFLTANAALISGDAALDVGCGVGAQSRELARHGFDVYAFDASPSAVRRAHEIGYPAIKYYVGDAVRLPFSDNYFDVVVEVSCLDTLSDPHACLASREIARVLKPRGCLFFIHRAAFGSTDEHTKVWQHTDESPVWRAISPDMGNVHHIYRDFQCQVAMKVIITEGGTMLPQIIGVGLPYKHLIEE